MKIKSDFVTNSSSSSFIVAFPAIIKTAHQVVDLVPDKFMRTVLNDAVDQTPIKANNPQIVSLLIKEIKRGYIGGFSSYDNERDIHKREGITSKQCFQNRTWTRIIYDEATLKYNAQCREVALKYLEGVPDDHYIYLFEYSDDTEYSSEMEHGDIFRKLPRLRISKH